MPEQGSAVIPGISQYVQVQSGMSFADFERLVRASREDALRDTLARHRHAIQVKNEQTAIRNLERIFSATLKISNEKGFQAMSIRDLSKETGLSTGALYSYFSGKDELLTMLQQHERDLVQRILLERIGEQSEPTERLRTAIRTHLYLTEAMQPWFYFSYMEAKNLSSSERKKAISSELYTEEIFADIIQNGQDSGVFKKRDPLLTAGIIKAILQDWYLKRSKFARRHVSVNKYADFAIAFVEAFCREFSGAD